MPTWSFRSSLRPWGNRYLHFHSPSSAPITSSASRKSVPERRRFEFLSDQFTRGCTGRWQMMFFAQNDSRVCTFWAFDPRRNRSHWSCSLHKDPLCTSQDLLSSASRDRIWNGVALSVKGGIPQCFPLLPVNFDRKGQPSDRRLIRWWYFWISWSVLGLFFNEMSYFFFYKNIVIHTSFSLLPPIPA